MPAKEMEPSLSSSGMGGKETSGSAYSPPRAPRPPRAPIPRPLSSLAVWSDPRWVDRFGHWLRTSPVVDWFYLVGVVAMVVLAGYILALK